ncbi:tryptophan synthase beta subunit-like PLP-dependent enzyme [Syncephalis plumigaleata]|nr:tryptophan synthase beta subunit-like PLP-dependent enzyme [Syncephalis plumigaleata]
MPTIPWVDSLQPSNVKSLSQADWHKILLGIVVGVAATELLGYLATNLWSAGRKKKKTVAQGRSLASRHSSDSLKSRNKHREQSRTTGRQYGQIANGVAGLIGNTPLLRLNALSTETGCEILASSLYLNPGGSPKDRVALYIIQKAEKDGLLGPPQQQQQEEGEGEGDSATLDEDRPIRRSTVFEGTVGSTGISLAMISRALGYACHIVVPDDQAQEKYALLERHGAHVERVRPASIVDKRQFVNTARQRAQEFDTKAKHYAERHQLSETERARGFFADQFENLANFQAHYETTGPRYGGKPRDISMHSLQVQVSTGGTIAGVANYLKRQKADIHVTLVDPTGSGLYHKVRHGVFYSPQEAEGTRRRHQVDTVVEGIGINRLTRNFALALPDIQRASFRDELAQHSVLMSDEEEEKEKELMDDWSSIANRNGWIDTAIRVTDEEAVAMSRYLVNREGIFVGSSSAVNCVGAVRLARQLGPGHTIVTILCDSGQRHLTKFWSDAYLEKMNIPIKLAKNLDFII